MMVLFVLVIIVAFICPHGISFNVNNNGLGTLATTKKSSSGVILPPPNAIAIPADNILIEDDVRTTTIDRTKKIPSESSWAERLDYDAFAKEVTDLGKELLKGQGQDDVDHLNKIVRWQNIAAIVGVATMWLPPNPISIIALSTWTYASWTMIAHHTCHGGYNRVDAGKYNSRGYALGTIKKRIEDWCDWMLPEAWNIEHNRLHHYHLGELEDPDLVQRNLEFLRSMNIPMALKYGFVGAMIPIWKWFYYAPNTYKELQLSKMRSSGDNRLLDNVPKDFNPTEAFTIGTMLFPKNEIEKAFRQIVDPLDFVKSVIAPFFISRFVLLPLPLLAIPNVGPSLFGNAIVNLLAAELLTNIHGFITIVTNHCGEDIYTFDDEVKPKSGSFYVRQIVGSTNYEAGTDAIDFSHGFLNYQIEHHVWPDLSMLSYQRGAPKLKAICEKHGVPYVQESVWTRLRKTIDVMVGKSTMRQFPIELEPSKDKATNGVTWKSTNGAIDE